jgi:uncharacterized membrane protein YkoI
MATPKYPVAATCLAVLLVLAAIVIAAIAIAAIPAQPAVADEHRCLDANQRRAAIAGHQAVPLTKAVRAARSHLAGDIVHARLCEHGQGLVYVLTVLAHDGKVARASIDGASGTFLRVY